MATLLVDKYEARKAVVLIALESGHILVAHVFGEADEVSESYKNNKHMHAKRDSIRFVLSKNKNAGGNPPALGQPSITERWLSYTTGQGAFSRCNYGKHMFVSQCITAGRLLGKVV